jgi:hypothetical protein
MKLDDNRARRIRSEAIRGGLICAFGAAVQVTIALTFAFPDRFRYSECRGWALEKELEIAFTGLILGAVTAATCQARRESRKIANEASSIDLESETKTGRSRHEARPAQSTTFSWDSIAAAIALVALVAWLVFVFNAFLATPGQYSFLTRLRRWLNRLRRLWSR